MRYLLTLTIQRTIEIEQEFLPEDWDAEYEKKRDKIIRTLEKQGWNVSIEDEED